MFLHLASLLVTGREVWVEGACTRVPAGKKEPGIPIGIDKLFSGVIKARSSCAPPAH